MTILMDGWIEGGMLGFALALLYLNRGGGDKLRAGVEQAVQQRNGGDVFCMEETS
jgi:hypothetical protein